MRAAKLLMSAAASAVLAGTADAQFLRPAAPVPGGLTSAPAAVLNGVAPPPPLGVGVGPGAQLPGSMNTIWSRLGISQEQREFCRRKICRTPAGQLLGRIQAPISTLSGGIIPPFCPVVPSIAELMDPGAIGAASKAKLDRAGAEERIKAVKYLGTLDCHYWPEAEDALIGALRGDRNECVRYEAAVALARGCCCTCKVIVALSHVVSCSDKDGFPYEKSARVRAVAAHALDRCMSSPCLQCNDLPCLPGVDAVETTTEKKDGTKLEQGKDKKDDKKDDENKDKKSHKLGDPEYPQEYYAKVARMSRAKLNDFGQKALEIGATIGYQVVGDVNARDYAAAGLNTSRDGQSVGAKPSTIWELMTWKDSGAAIGNPLMGPPAAYSGVATPPNPNLVPARQVVQPIPAFVPSGTMPPAVTASRPRVSAPPVQETLVPVPAVSLPSATAAPKPLPQPLTVPTLAPAKAAPPAAVPAKPIVVAPQPTPKPVVMTPLPAPVPAKPVVMTPPTPMPMPTPKPAVASTPAPAPRPVAVTPAPQKFPAVMQPTMAAPTAAAPAIVPPKAEPKPVPVATAPALPPVEKVVPTVDVPVEKLVPAAGVPDVPVEKIAPQADLPPVEKFAPGK
jgi:hypothetical protein